MQLAPQQAQAAKAVEEWLKDPQGRQFFYLAGYAGTGKEQPVSAIVQTPQGPRSLGSIQVGDFVFGRNGKPTKVTGVFPQGEKQAYKVSFRDGSSTRCGLDHLWEVSNKKGSRVMSLRDIMNAGHIWPSGDRKFQIPLCDPVEYDTPHPAADPYTIGVLIGDGYLHGNTISFSTHDQDGEVAKYVQDALPEGLSLKRDDAASCPRYTVKDAFDYHTNRLGDHLRSVGLRCRSTTKFIPPEYLFAPIDDRIALLRGLMDTDGSIVNNRTSFSTSSEALARDVISLVQSLGGTAILKRYERKDGKSVEFQINVKTKFNPFRLPRKADRWSPSTKNPPSRYLWDIEKCGIEEQVCIKVDADDELYLTDDFIVTHNTTIAKVLAGSVRDVLFAAFTGKAALVLQTKGCHGASTIHSLIYKVEDHKSPLPRFILDYDSPVAKTDLVIIDEVSMVGEDLARDLLFFGKRVLVLGDPAQLPPISGEGYFTSGEPDFMLTEVHRQAADNPIIHLSMIVREGGRLERGDYGESRVIARSQLKQREVVDADQVLVGRNLTRRRYNARLRELLGFSEPHFMVGDRVICLKNNKEKGLFNGGIWSVDKIRDQQIEETTMEVSPLDNGMVQAHALVRTHHAWLKGEENNLNWKAAKKYQPFDYAYAITVHKAQGSQWNDVLIFDESGVFQENSEKHLYTALTRAAEKVTVVL